VVRRVCSLRVSSSTYLEYMSLILSSGTPAVLRAVTKPRPLASLMLSSLAFLICSDIAEILSYNVTKLSTFTEVVLQSYHLDRQD